MSVAIITGSAGLIGSEAAMFFANLGFDVVGIDNNMRRIFFGEDASTEWQRRKLERELATQYKHFDADIRDTNVVTQIFQRYSSGIKLVIHAASQPSHDWAARDPMTDFSINASGTLNLLEATRKHSPQAVFLFNSTNKVYGDTPNRLPLMEKDLRWEIEPSHTYKDGIREDMTVDQSLHSLFGASKLAADLLVQEYGRYFGLYSACFRGGCLTGPKHSATQLHGFLGYLMKCAVTKAPYMVYGYKAKQVRDNLHSSDLLYAFYEFFQSPRMAEVYNIGGGRFSNCSILEAIQLAKEIIGVPLGWNYTEQNRTGDHIWWITDNGKFMAHFPNWKIRYDVPKILKEIYETNRDRWLKNLNDR